MHGLQGSGKSKLVEWLMHLWGFDLPQGLAVRSEELSVVGMQAAANQYGNLPLWFDEYRAAEVSLAKLSVLQNAYNRGAGYKMTRVRRQTRTAFIMSGESTTDDAAARGRCLHVQVSAQRCLADNLGPELWEGIGAMTAVFNQGEGYADPVPRSEHLERQGPRKRQQRHKTPTAKPRLCWTRQDLVQATGLSYRTIFNLEACGLLQRLVVGVNVAVYTDASVRALFGAEVIPQIKVPAPPEPRHHSSDDEKTEVMEPELGQRAGR